MAKSDTTGEAARPWQSYHTVYTNAKAGMDGVDKEKVQRIVYEMSKGSKYFENEERKEAFIKQKIDNMRSRCAKLTGADISHYQKDTNYREDGRTNYSSCIFSDNILAYSTKQVADKRILELEATRDLSRIWIHVDMDAFYAAVETLSNPSLKGRPMAVGSMSMISTANYEARKFGVRAAMPGFIARKLCPELIFVPTDFKKYNYYSDLTRTVFQNYDPNFMAASLDEAYLDVTQVCKERGITGEEVAEEIRASVNEKTGLTCSAGVAPNRLLAKVCSDINKPNGQFVLPNNRLAVMTFISSLPIRKIGGIGKVTEHVLRDAFGIKTCEDMLQKGSYICALFSSSSADFFLSVGLGLGRTDAPEVRLRKSISNERTFSATGDKTFLYHKLGDIADMLSTDMQKESLCGRTLTLKLKTASFEVRTRAVTLPKYISSSEEILKHASKLLKAELPVSLRLIGLRVSHLNENGNGAAPDPAQKTLTNFIVSGDASKKVMDNHSSLGADIGSRCFINEDETSVSIGSHETCSSNHRDPSDCIHSSKLEDSNSTFSNDGEQMEKFQKTTSENIEKTQDGLTQLLGADYSLPVQFEGSCLDRLESETGVLGSNTASSSNQGELFSWVNGYMCSICGIELPPNFVEERREHSDFHLAKQLQEEESGTGFRTSMLRPRIVQKDPIASQGKRKKQKLSLKEGKHVPIDLFFVKSKQNF